ASNEILSLVRSVFAFIINYEGEIPGSRPGECGNYTDMSLTKAKKYAYCYYNNILMNIDESRLTY
ncbi:MAG: S-ribosylhomocysteine lyase, partial [Bacilli bacterium]|nr:S-ribosylhomocysteine lyase [Bacilli bacterium]